MATFPVYLALADVDEYLAASPRATAFLSLSNDTREQWMVEATRMLNRQAWAGTPTEDYPEDQDLAWPRDGITGVTDGETPQAILDAFCELTLALYLDAALLHRTSTGNNVQSVVAKGVGVTFFSASEDSAGRFPVIVQELVGAYLGGGAAYASIVTGAVSGECETSQFTECHDFDLTDGG